MINCFYDCYSVLNKVYSEKAFIKQALSSTLIEEKNRALTVKICYGVLDRDLELSYYIKHLTTKSPKSVIRTILKISMFAIKYLNKKEFAVTKNAVELVKKLGKGGMSGFVNAFLRKFIATDIPLPTDKIENISIKYSYPKFVYGVEKAEKILEFQKVQTALSFYQSGAEEYLNSRKVNFTKSTFDNVYLTENFVRDSKYDQGFYTYQALGSVAICEAVEPCKNLLDCCAAPGGKSVRLSYKCDKVTSWDIHPHRVELIKSYIARMKRDNVTFFVHDAKVLDESLIDSFDAVLCDAPCSGLGVANDNPDIKLNRTKDDIVSLNNEQKQILSTVSKYVKVGGYLYYSTCSILKQENSEIVKDFLKNNDNFVCEKIDSPLPHEYDLGLVFLPDISGGLGFYMSKLKRIK